MRTLIQIKIQTLSQFARHPVKTIAQQEYWLPDDKLKRFIVEMNDLLHEYEGYMNERS